MGAGDQKSDLATAVTAPSRGPRANYFGLFVGINDYDHLRPLRFARADAVAMHEVMTHADSGTIPTSQARLSVDAVDRERLTADLTWLTSGRSNTDVAFLYVAGHGIEVDGQVYLATEETSVDQVRDNLTAALAMRQLRETFFERTEAGLVIFVLDCCYSGAMADEDARTVKADVGEAYFQRSRGRLAVMACAPDETARESADMGHGVFTNHFLAALRGRTTSAYGTVTLQGAIAYVAGEMGENQRPGFFGQQFGPAVLTTPAPQLLQVDETASQRADVLVDARVDLSAPRHSIDAFEGVIDGIISRLAEAAPEAWGLDEDSRERFGLGIVLDVLGASSAFVVRYERVRGGTARVLQRLERLPDAAGQAADQLASIVSAVDGGMRSTYVVPHSDTAFAIFVPNREESAFHLGVAVTSDPLAGWTDVLIVANIPADSPLLADPTTRIIRTLFTASDRFTRIDPVHVEAAMLDELRRTMGLLPPRAYLRRLDLFSGQLRDLEAHFQPVVHLFASNPTIHSWEALARTSAGHTPHDVFAAAELWGAQYMAQLDSYMLDRAVSQFAEQANMVSEHHGRSQALSVNCYPSSLMKDRFREQLREIVGRKLLPSRDLTLEISEKHELPFPRGLLADTSTASIEGSFRRSIEELSHELKINFAIDDFGVGYSSIARLLGLRLSYVKVDRELLGHTAAPLTFEYISKVVHHRRTMVPTIVAEGYEGTDNSQLELGDLVALDIDYVQGFGVRRPSSAIAPLTAEERAFVKGRMGVRRGAIGARDSGIPPAGDG